MLAPPDARPLEATPAEGPLVAANRDVHRVLDHLHEDVFLALLDGDPGAARVAWLTLGEALAAHQAVEEPALAAHPTPHPPRGGSHDLVLAEHRRLNLLWDQGLGILDELVALSSTPTLRRAIVRALDRLLRLHHLLDHHGEREHALVYPDLDARLAAFEAEALAAALHAAIAPFDTRSPSPPDAAVPTR